MSWFLLSRVFLFYGGSSHRNLLIRSELLHLSILKLKKINLDSSLSS